MTRFPAPPVNTPAELTHISPSYRKNAVTSVMLIFLFVLVYLLLAAIACVGAFYIVLLAVAMIETGIFLLIIAAIGVFLVAGILVAFFFQFLIANKKKAEEDTIQITEKDHPEVFRMINEVCSQVKAPQPKKVVVSLRNNASVFQDVGFFKLIVPPRKNLEIGLTLVSTLDISEFKAILAHEFGHFSQSSTRIGAYVYSVNNLIGTLVNSRDFWDEFSGTWFNSHPFLRFAGMASRYITNGFRWVFTRLYIVLNKGYLGLSREMEFHADAVAVSVTGNEAIISALRRIQVMDYCVETFENFLAAYSDEKKKLPDNFISTFDNFLPVFAERTGLTFSGNGLPDPGDENLSKLSGEKRVKYKNLWSSHPDLADRERNARLFPVQCETCSEPAKQLFSNWDELCCRLTNVVAKAQGREAGGMQVIPATECAAGIMSLMAKRIPAAHYRGLYDLKIMSKLNLEVVNDGLATREFGEIINDAEEGLVKEVKLKQQDLQELAAIADKVIDVRWFEYNGTRYKWKEARGLTTGLEKDIDEAIEMFAKKDSELFAFHLRRSPDAVSYAELYEAGKIHNQLYLCAEEIMKPCNELLPAIQELMTRQVVEQHEVAHFRRMYDRAMIAFSLVTEKIGKLNFPGTIGEIELDKGIIHFMWPERLPDFRGGIFSLENVGRFWEKLNRAAQNISRLQMESHWHILALYKQRYTHK